MHNASKKDKRIKQISKIKIYWEKGYVNELVGKIITWLNFLPTTLFPIKYRHQGEIIQILKKSTFPKLPFSD